MILLDYKDRRPIYEQIVERFSELILKGVLEADSQLPSVRNLAMELSINPNTIQRAYQELERQGYIYSIKGRGSFIAQNEELAVNKRKELMKDIKKKIGEGRDMGVEFEEVINVVRECYKEVPKDD